MLWNLHYPVYELLISSQSNVMILLLKHLWIYDAFLKKRWGSRSVSFWSQLTKIHTFYCFWLVGPSCQLPIPRSIPNLTPPTSFEPCILGSWNFISCFLMKLFGLIKAVIDLAKSCVPSSLIRSMGESFQDYSWIQDFYGKSASKCCIRQILIAPLVYFQFILGQFKLKFLICKHTTSFQIWILKVQDFRNFELSPM